MNRLPSFKRKSFRIQGARNEALDVARGRVVLVTHLLEDFAEVSLSVSLGHLGSSGWGFVANIFVLWLF